MINLTHHEYAILMKAVEHERLAAELKSGSISPFDMAAINAYCCDRKVLLRLEEKLEAAMLQE